MRRKLRSALQLQPAERALLWLAWIRLLWVGLALRILPLSKVQLLLSARFRRPVPVTISPARLACLVAAASRHHLLALHCLQRSLVLQSLLRDQGFEVDLRIGVRRKEGGMEAHAWVEQDGHVIGDVLELVQRYFPLERLAG